MSSQLVSSIIILLYKNVFSLKSTLKNSRDDNQNPGDKSGTTPLHLAAEEGHEEICKLIVENVHDR